MRQRYRLVIEAGEAALRNLTEAQRSIVVAKRTGNAIPDVVWLAWHPSIRNVITWDDSYGLYASEIPTSHGSVPQILDFVYPARDGAAYPFAGTMFASPHDRDGIPRGHYDVDNSAPFTATFGLVQTALLNGILICSRLNAVALPSGLTADFSPGTTLYVWTDGGLQSGAVISRIPDDATVIDFSRTRTARCCYDTDTRSFVRVTTAFEENG
jgi:hypothetical protein